MPRQTCQYKSTARVRDSECPGNLSPGWNTLVYFVHIIYNRLMRSVSATDAKQRLAALLDAAQREPVLIRRQNRDVAVIMSAEEYERIRRTNVEEFQKFCDRVGAEAVKRGMTEEILADILKD